MKKYLVILFAGLSLLFASCVSNSAIDNLQSQIDELKSGQIASIENQIFNINGSITTLQEADREIKGYITALQNTASELQKSINTANERLMIFTLNTMNLMLFQEENGLLRILLTARSIQKALKML